MAHVDQVARQIESEILQGVHGLPAERFMTVRQLAERYGISLVTAHKVTQRLKAAGLLVGQSTAGAIISPSIGSRLAAGTGRPRRLGLIVTNINTPFFSSLCHYLQRAAAEREYQILMASSQYDFQRERRAVEGFLEIGVEGLLVVPGLDEACAEYYRQLIASGVKLMFVSRRLEEVPGDSVVANSFVGGASVAGHFLSLGYRSCAYLGFDTRLKKDVRLSGYRSALFEEGLTLSGDQIALADGGTPARGYEAMAQLMSRRERPRAVFAFHDLLAIGAIRYCREHGLSVPGDVAIAGFDNLPQSQVTSPALTTVSYPVESMANLAVQCLLERIGATTTPEHRVLLEPHLIVRESTDPESPHSEEVSPSFESLASMDGLL
jgi:LacI family transcriptional regulator